MLRLHEAESKLAVVQSEKDTAEEQVRRESSFNSNIRRGGGASFGQSRSCLFI